MPRKTFVFILCVLLSCALLVPGAQAQDSNADCRNLEDPSASGWTSYAQKVAELERIERTSGGRVDVEVFGRSNRGRDLHAARVGSGDRVLLVTSAIHGNEKTGTEALLHWLRHVGSSGHADVRALLEDITFVAVPMFNPDGGELNRRQNDFPWAEVVQAFPRLAGAPPAWYYSSSARGFDVNRDFNPDLGYEPRAADLPGADALPGFFLTPEARALRALYLELRDEFGAVDGYVDLHHMGPCEQIEGDGDYVTVALDYPPLGPEDSDKYDAWPLLDQDKSRRFAYAAYLGMRDHAGNGNADRSPFLGGVARYLHPQSRDLPGQARSSFALNGTATVLFEVRGQSDDWGQKKKGQLAAIVEAGVDGIARRLADGSIETLDGDRFFDLPDYGWDDDGD
jgi:Zinc carboxypeptidase